MPQKAFEGGIFHVRAYAFFSLKCPHFRKNENKKVRHFEKKARDRFENEKITENECVRFWGI